MSSIPTLANSNPLRRNHLKVDSSRNLNHRLKGLRLSNRRKVSPHNNQRRRVALATNKPKMAKPALLPLSEACVLLVGQYTDNERRRVKRWIEQGVIQAVQDGAKFYIPRAEINRLAGEVNGQEMDARATCASE